MISSMLPCIGHTGICDTTGVAHDFAGPYSIGHDDLAFGEAYKYVVLDLEGVTEDEYNKAINKANKIYCKRMHNICCDNCHSHVANALNHLKYKGRDNYTMIDVWWMCIWNSRYVSFKHLFCTYIGFAVLALIFCFFVLSPTVFVKK
jgi:hypothetical protein